MALVKAFDAASPQAHLDFAIPKKTQGYTVAYVKVGGDNLSPRYIAPHYVEQVDSADQAGYDHLGHYWVTGGNDPAASAAFYVKALHLFDHATDFLVLDNERLDDGRPWTDAECDTWVARVTQNLGITPRQVFVYFGAAALRASTWPLLEKRGVQVIVAAYDVNDGVRHAPPDMGGRFGGQWSGHQYTSVGRITGWGTVDMDLDVFQADAFNFGGVAPTPAPAPVSASNPTPPAPAPAPVPDLDEDDMALYFKGDTKPDVFVLNPATGKKRRITGSEWKVARGHLEDAVTIPQADADLIPAV